MKYHEIQFNHRKSNELRWRYIESLPVSNDDRWYAVKAPLAESIIWSALGAAYLAKEDIRNAKIAYENAAESEGEK